MKTRYEPCEHGRESIYLCSDCCPIDPRKIRTVGLQFSYGREQFHGRTIKEQTDEMFANAKKYGNEPPQYEGRAVLR